MTFGYLLSAYCFDEIVEEFKALWRVNAPKQADSLDLEGWRKIYQSLQELDAKSSPYYICLRGRWEGCSPLVDMNCTVREGGNDTFCSPMASHPSWAEVLGMEIVVDGDVQITPQELTAGLLWEITYYGGTEELVKDFHEGYKQVQAEKINLCNLATQCVCGLKKMLNFVAMLSETSAWQYNIEEAFFALSLDKKRPFSYTKGKQSHKRSLLALYTWLFISWRVLGRTFIQINKRSPYAFFI